MEKGVSYGKLRVYQRRQLPARRQHRVAEKGHQEKDLETSLNGLKERAEPCEFRPSHLIIYA